MKKERFPEGVGQWLETGYLEEQDWILEQGLRYSPQMLRYAGYYIAKNAEAPLVKYGNNLSLEQSIAFYLMFIGAIDREEYGSRFGVSEGKPPEVGAEQLLKPESIQLRNTIRPSIENVSEDIEKIRTVNKNAVVVFNHGKFNTFPHVGYMFTYLTVMRQMEEMGHFEDDVIYIVANETNNYIQSVGDTPFLNTAWRVSANSYMPYDFICPADKYKLENAQDYWTDAYSSLRPDFVIINSEDKLAEKLREQVKRAGSGISTIEFRELAALDVDVDEDENIIRERKIHTSSIGDFDHGDVLTLIGLANYLYEEEIRWGTFDRSVDWSYYLKNG